MLIILAAALAQAAPPSLWQASARVGATTASPNGADLLVAVDHQLQVRAPGDGTVLAKVTICDDPVAIGFTNEKTAVIVCENQAQTVAWPELAVSSRATWTGKAEAGAIGAGVFAVGFSDGKLSIYTGDAATPIDHQSWTDIKTLQFDPAGKRVLLANDDRKPLRIYPLQGEPTVMTPTGDVAAFSPDGTQLFALASSFKATLSTMDGTVKSEFRTGSWINEARFLSATQILAGGSEGLVIYQVGAAKPVQTIADGARWSKLAVGDGWQCAADWSNLQCWGSASTAVSQVQAQAQPQADPTAAGSPEFGTKGLDTTPVPSELTLISRRGTTITARLSEGPVPVVGTTTSMSKLVTKQLGRMHMTAWMEIAEVKVAKLTGGTVTLTLVEEKSVVTVNGEKVDHFKTGSQIRLQ